MNLSYLITGALALAFLVLFGVAELLYHRYNIRAELTRKFVHFFTGILTLLFPALLDSHWLVLILCSSFLIILGLSLKLKMLPSINDVDRKTQGSILYPIIVYGCFLIYQYFDNLTLFYVPILTLALCDPIAALVGKYKPWRPYQTFGRKKTLSGSIGFFSSALLLSLFLFIQMEDAQFLHALLIGSGIALTTTFAEALSHGGYDNFTIPSTAVITILIFKYLPFFTCLH